MIKLFKITLIYVTEEIKPETFFIILFQIIEFNKNSVDTFFDLEIEVSCALFLNYDALCNTL